MKTFLMFLVLFLVPKNTEAQTSLTGKVMDTETDEPIIFGTIAIYSDGVLKTGGETDFDGNYSINPLAPGTYDVEFSYIGMPTTRITGVVVAAGKNNQLDIQIGNPRHIVRQKIIPKYRRKKLNIIVQTPKVTISKTPFN